MSWNWDCDRKTQSNLTTDFQNSANLASNNGLNSESTNKGRSRSPVRKIMRNRSSESSGVVIADTTVNNLRQRNSGGSRISRFHSATSSSKDYGPNSSHIQSQDDEDYWMNRNKRSNKDVVATDVYGEKYVSTLQHEPEQEDNSQTSNEDDEAIQEYQNKLMKIQSFSGQVTQDKDFACEQLFKDYCDALELQSEVNFKFKTKNRKRLNAFSIEVFNGSFYWQEIEGQYLIDSEQARQRAFATACTVLIEKFGWAIRAKMGYETKNLPQQSAELALQNTADKIENPQLSQNSWDQATKNYWTTWASHFGMSIPHPQPYYPPPLPPNPPPANQPYVSTQSPSGSQPQLLSGSPHPLNRALYMSQTSPVTPYSNVQPPLPTEPYPYDDPQPPLPLSDNSQPLLSFGQVVEKPLQPLPSTQALTHTQPSLSLPSFMQTPVQPPLPPEPFVQIPLKPPLPPQPFLQSRLQPPLPPEPFMQKPVNPPLPPQTFVQTSLHPPLPSESFLQTRQDHLCPPQSPQPQLVYPQPSETDQTSQLLIQQPSQNLSPLVPLPCKQPPSSPLSLPSPRNYKSTRNQPLLSHKPIIIRFNQPDATLLPQEIKRVHPQQPLLPSKKIKIAKSPLPIPAEIKQTPYPSTSQQSKCLEHELPVSLESQLLESPARGVKVQHRSKPPSSVSKTLPVSSVLDSQELLDRTKLTPTTTKSMSLFSLPPPEVRLYHPLSNSPSNQSLLNEALQPPVEFCDNSTICPPDQSFGTVNETLILPPPKSFSNNIDLPNVSAPPTISPLSTASSMNTALDVQKPGLTPIQKTGSVGQIIATKNANLENSKLENPKPCTKRPRNLISLVSSAPRILWHKKCSDASPNIISSKASSKVQTNTQEQIESTLASSLLPDKCEIPSPSKTDLVTILESPSLVAEVPKVSYTIEETKVEESQKTVISFPNNEDIETQKKDMNTQSMNSSPCENNQPSKQTEINVEIEISNNEVTTTTPQILLDPEIPMTTNGVIDSSLISSDGNLSLKETEIASGNIPNPVVSKLENISSASKVLIPLKDEETIVGGCPVSSTISTQHSIIDQNEVYSRPILNQESKKQLECYNVKKSQNSKPAQVIPKRISKGVKNKGISSCQKLPFGYATQADLEFLRSLTSNTIAEPESCSIKQLDILFTSDSPASKKPSLQNKLIGKAQIVPKLGTKTLIHQPVPLKVPPKPVAPGAPPTPLSLAVQPKPVSLAELPKPVAVAVLPQPVSLAVPPQPLSLVMLPQPVGPEAAPKPVTLGDVPQPVAVTLITKTIALEAAPKPVTLEAVSQPKALALLTKPVAPEAAPKPVTLEAVPQPVAVALLTKSVSLTVQPKPTNKAIVEDKNENINKVEVQNRNKIHEERSMNEGTDTIPNRFTMASTGANCSYKDSSFNKHPPPCQQWFQRRSQNYLDSSKTQYLDQCYDPQRSFDQHHGQPTVFTSLEDPGFDRDPDFDRDPEFAAGPSISFQPNLPILPNNLRTNSFHNQKHSLHPHQGFSINHGNLNRRQHLDPDCGQRSWETRDEVTYSDCVSPTFTPHSNRFYPHLEETQTSFPNYASYRGRGRRSSSHRGRPLFPKTFQQRPYN